MMGRPPCCDKSNVKRGLWTSEEDAKILAYVAKHGIGNWTMVPQKAGLNRCGKSCRLRWTNYLRPDLKHNNFTPEEEQLIIDYHEAIGSRWSLIARQLPGRTDNDVKNHWNTKLKKRLTKMGIDPITHKPFSQIMSDYERINIILPHPENQIEPLIVHLNNALAFPNEQSSISTITQPQHFQENNAFGNIMSQENLNLQSNHLPEFSSSASSSSSNISEFLLGDPFWEQKQEPVFFENKEKFCSEAASSSMTDKSFVEAMLDRDTEMQMELPEFFNEYFNY